MPFIGDPHPLSEKYEAGSGSGSGVGSGPASVTASASASTTNTYDIEKSEEFMRQVDVEEGQSFNNHRRRWLRLLIIVGIIAAVILALAIGLGVGLTGRNDNDQTTSDGSDTTSDEGRFPAGNFTFETSLISTRTSCTSNPATWRCFPFENGSSAKFYWIISEPDKKNADYTISSSDNPFAPSFKGLTLARFDQGNSDERFEFSFNTTRNIVPSDSIGANNRVATCSFKNTMFEATLWTRRRNNETLPINDAVDGKYADWPGDIEVRQIKEAELGQPMCEDDQGTEIADVQAAQETASVFTLILIRITDDLLIKRRALITG